MKKMKLILALIFLFESIIADNLVEDKYYIQLYPSKDKTKPYLSHFYTLNSDFFTINSTEEENMIILNKSEKINDTPIKKLSLVSKFENFLIKTCFSPDKIVEITDEKNEILIPNDPYFNNVQKNLENIEYCYTTSIANIYNMTRHVIVTYWTERFESNGNQNYAHRSILFFPHNKTFSKVYTLDSKGQNYFAQSCTNLRNKYIYCNIDQSSSLTLSKTHHFSVIPSFITKEEIAIIIRLVKVYNSSSISVYHKPIGTFKYFYSKIGKYVEYFLLESHDKKKNITKLITSAYVNIDLNSFINQKEKNNIGVYNGINIEAQYIEPNLFNNLIPNTKDLIIIYIMKDPKRKNLLILNNYDYNNELKTKTDLHKFSNSNYLRDDICDNPKYMQSMFIKSLIKYDWREQEYIEDDTRQQYYKYQRDIASLISCDDGKGNVFYQAKKIKMPQCLNILNEINGMNDSFIFTKNISKIILDIDKNPNYKSLKDIEIIFEDSLLYNNYIIVQGVKNGVRLEPIMKAKTLNNIERLEFSRTLNFKPGRTYQIPYRIKQTKINGISNTCHLTSDLCYFQFYFEETIEEEEEEEEEECKYCEIINDGKCLKCQDIIGLINLDDGCNCHCNTKNGFKEEPDFDKEMCLCKPNFSFYKDISKCLPDTVLKNTSYCILAKDERSFIYIYDDLSDDLTICYNNDLPYCCPKSIPTSIITTLSNIPSTSLPTTFTPITPPPPPPDCQKNIWFSLGQDIFYFIKIEKCVYILYNNSLVMYSNKSDCEYKANKDYNKCLEININNEDEYNYILNNSYEYKPEDGNHSLIIKKNSKNSNITFYLLNNFTENFFSSVQLSKKCIEKVKEGYNLPYLLIFIANIKKENYITTQVEYSFYYPSPELIHQNLNVSSFCYKPENKSNNTNKRFLEVREEWTNNNNYSVDVDEILVNVQIDFNSEQKNHIKELKNKSINIFDSEDDFYNDVCFKYTTPNNTDIYLQDRREKYYITDPLCETGCKQVGYDNITERVICICKIKGSTEGFENVSFSSNEIERQYFFPNIRVMKCFFECKITIGEIFSLILFILFLILSLINIQIFCCCKSKKSLFFKLSNNENNEDNKKNKSSYDWEKPLEELLNMIESYSKDLEEEQKKEEENESKKDEKDQEDPDVEQFRKKFCPPNEEESKPPIEEKSNEEGNLKNNIRKRDIKNNKKYP